MVSFVITCPSSSPSSFRQITYNRQPPSLDWRAVSSGCDLLQPVRTVMSLIVSTVWCCRCIVFVASRVFAFLLLLLLYRLLVARSVVGLAEGRLCCELRHASRLLASRTYSHSTVNHGTPIRSVMASAHCLMGLPIDGSTSLSQLAIPIFHRTTCPKHILATHTIQAELITGRRRGLVEGNVWITLITRHDEHQLWITLCIRFLVGGPHRNCMRYVHKCRTINIRRLIIIDSFANNGRWQRDQRCRHASHGIDDFATYRSI